MQALPKKNPAQLLLSYLHTVPNKAEVIVMFDKELFYSLCENYKVELSRDYNCPMMRTEEGLVRELKEEDMKDSVPVSL